jgi:catechol 2,3-dioxygenase-like lactoylglutathione lyase family enzyme
MQTYQVTHIALRVADLQQAEAFYTELFDLQVAWREAERATGWATLPPNKTWDDVHAANQELDLVMVYRPGLALALERATDIHPAGTLSHVGISADAHAVASISQRAQQINCTIIQQSARAVVFQDPFGVQWECSQADYSDPVQLSTGARMGQWLDL